MSMIMKYMQDWMKTTKMVLLQLKSDFKATPIKYRKTAVSIPFGIGVKYSVSRRIGLAAEWRWHYAITDWLDDCHGYYPRYTAGSDAVEYADPTGFTADNNGNNLEAFIQRGNSADNDWYSYLNVSITYKFYLPSGKDCNKKERYKNYD